VVKTDESILLNKMLAELLGWTNIVHIDRSLMGTPPPGEYSCRNQGMVPDWANDWHEWGEISLTWQCLPDKGRIDRWLMKNRHVQMEPIDLYRQAVRLSVIEEVIEKVKRHWS
jgi:hypothetical protein